MPTGYTVTSERIFDEARTVTNAADGSEEVRVAAVLLAAAHVGATAARIAQLLDVPKKDIHYIVWRLQSQGVFRRGRIHHSGWDDVEFGGAAFCLDVAVGMGYLDVVRNPRRRVFKKHSPSEARES